MPKAASLAAAIKQKKGVAATVTPGKTGEFTVWRDGEKLWDKHESGRFPEHDEILRQL